MKQHYGAWGKADSNAAALVHEARRRGALVGQDRHREHGRRVNICKAAIRRLDQSLDHLAELMRDYSLTEGKVRTLIAKVRQEA